LETKVKISFSEQAHRIQNRINELAVISEMPVGITRRYGTDAFIKGRSLIQKWMDEAGLQTRIDSIGNLRGRWPSANPNAKTFVIGSHIDTVINAGRFDGSLGVLMGLEMVEANTISDLPFNIDIVAFCDEEGSRFHTTYLGSSVLAGSFNYSFLERCDNDGLSLGIIVKNCGGDPEKILSDAMKKQEWLGYFEIHIEQGPVLYKKNIPVAVVSSIAGQFRLELRLIGNAGHAGTVPMNMRQDALSCAAECVLAIESVGKNHKDKMVATVGKLDVIHAASNVIPGEVRFTIDMRSPNIDFLQDIKNQLIDRISAICDSRNIHFSCEVVQESNPVYCDPELNNLLAESVRESGFELLELYSGAGHDAVAIAGVAPISMMFVRCFEGISHNPKEDVELKDIEAGLKVAQTYIKNLIQKYKN